MALFKRMGSLRRSHRAGAYSLPRQVEAKGMERSKGMVRCHITLLDDTVFTCDIDVSCVCKISSLECVREKERNRKLSHWIGHDLVMLHSF